MALFPLLAALVLNSRTATCTQGSSFDEQAVLSRMGLSYGGFIRLSDAVATSVYWDEGVEAADRQAKDPADRLLLLGQRLRYISDEVLKRERAPQGRLLQQWMFSQACCAYVVSHLDYDFEVIKQPIPVRNRLAETDKVLAQPPGIRKTMCVGFVLLARDLIRSGGTGLGIDANFVGSFWRDLGGEVTPTSNHAFLGLTLENGLAVGAELVTPRMKLKDFRTRCTTPRSDFVMPLLRRDRRLLIAMNFGADETPNGGTNHGDPQNVFHLSNISFDEWRAMPSAQLASEAKQAMRDFDGRAKWVKVD